jgi:hypothetical protein
LLALSLSIGLFLFWLVVGTALLSLLRVSGAPLKNLLLAPAAGFAVVLLTVFLVSRGGVPLGIGALPLALGIALVSVGVLWRMRSPIAFRSYLPFTLILFGALFATGRPMLEFGFDWLSYSNDDMANYTLAAQRLVSHGFFEIPRAEELVTGRDYTLAYWFFNLGIRPGAELLIAWVSGLTRLSPHQVFMSLTLGLHMVMISAAGALACRGQRPRLSAAVVCCLLAVSAMTSLGALYQLIAQVGGLALLIGCAEVLMRHFVGFSRGEMVRQGILIGLFGAALFVMYPEVVPFLGLSWLLFLALSFARRREKIYTALPVLGAASLVGVVLLNSYALLSLVFLGKQATAGTAHADLETLLFPYFLLPSGLATLWGLQNLVKLSSEPWLSTSILLGAALLIATAAAAVRGTWRLQPAAVITLVMVVFGVGLFVQRGDFGLFKLAMFIQPFALPTLVLAWVGVSRHRMVQVTPFVALAVAGLIGQTGYVERSRGLLEGTGGGLTEIPNASGARINTEFQTLLASSKADAFVLDTSNVVLAKFQTLYLVGNASTFATQDFFYNIANADPGLQLFNPNIAIAARELQSARNQRFADLSFDLLDENQPGLSNGFVADVIGQPPQVEASRSVLIESSGKQTLLNRWANQTAPNVDFEAHPWSQVSNHIIFISSLLGQPYYTPFRQHVALYQLEPDIFQPGHSMSGLGRYFLFQVVNPTPTVRFVLDLTTTLAADGVNRLPPAVVIGADRKPFDFVGRGSARVFSPAVAAQMIDGRAYLSVDMLSDGQRFPSDRTGLMNLYGLDVPQDRRRLVGFGRDMSVVSEYEYTHLNPPASLGAFPDALQDPQLEYSGIYEDGWVSETSYFELSQPDGQNGIAIRGTVPASSDGDAPMTGVQVLIDGQQVLRKSVPPGEFELSARVPSIGAARRRVELHFDRIVRLGAPDNRLAAAKLTFLGFVAPVAAETVLKTSESDVVAASSGLELGAGWYPFEKWAGQTFRWVNNDAQIVMDRTANSPCTLSVDLEPGPGVGSKAFTIQVYDASGSVLTSATIHGRETLQIPPQASGGIKAVRLHAEGGGHATAGDPRVLNFRVFDLGCNEDLSRTPGP